MKIIRWKHQTFYLHFLGWLQGFAEIVDGIVTVVSLGFLTSSFEITLSGYRAKVYFQHVESEQNMTTNKE